MSNINQPNYSKFWSSEIASGKNYWELSLKEVPGHIFKLLSVYEEIITSACILCSEKPSKQVFSFLCKSVFASIQSNQTWKEDTTNIRLWCVKLFCVCTGYWRSVGNIQHHSTSKLTETAASFCFHGQICTFTWLRQHHDHSSLLLFHGVCQCFLGFFLFFFFHIMCMSKFYVINKIIVTQCVCVCV